MKFLPVLLFLIVCRFSGATAFGQANDLVRIEVRVQSESDRQANKGTTADTVTQMKTLFITLRGRPKTPETRTGKWRAFGREMDGRDVVVLESGEFTVDLSVGGTQVIESKKVTTTSTPAHMAGKKKVEAKGVKYVGYGVQIFDGEKNVGEWFDPQGLKQEVK